MYGIVQFAANEGGSISVVVNKWFTPQKTGVYWPPCKDNKGLYKNLERCTTPDPEKWQKYSVDRVFYETDELQKAKEKVKLLEVTSDIQTEEENDTRRPRRKTVRRARLYSSDEDDWLEPPPLKKQFEKYLKLDILPELSRNTSGEAEKEQYVTIPPAAQTLRVCNNKEGKNEVINSTALEISHIKSQNNQILLMLQDIKAKLLQGDTNSHGLLNLIDFPLKEISDVSLIEEKIENDKEFFKTLVKYLRNIGGRQGSEKTSRVLKFLMTDELATNYSYYGKRSNKIAFVNLVHLKTAVLESLRGEQTSEKEIEDNIKAWLKHAPDRQKAKLKRASLS